MLIVIPIIAGVAGYFFSLNKPEALNAIEIKVGFVAFPILLFASNYTETHIKKIVISYCRKKINLFLVFLCVFAMKINSMNFHQ